MVLNSRKTTIMNAYRIYHPVGGVLNTECVRGQHEYEVIADIPAISLHQAYFKSQNDFNDEYALLDKRSTSVGDIIQDPRGKTFMIKPMGFDEVPGNVTRFVDWGNH